MPLLLTNVAAILIELMNRVFKRYLDLFVIYLIDIILIFSRNSDDYDKRLQIILQILKEKKLYANFPSVIFCLMK